MPDPIWFYSKNLNCSNKAVPYMTNKVWCRKNLTLPEFFCGQKFKKYLRDKAFCQNDLPYICHYKPQLVYFLPHFSLKYVLNQEIRQFFSLKSTVYNRKWLQRKSQLKWRVSLKYWETKVFSAWSLIPKDFPVHKKGLKMTYLIIFSSRQWFCQALLQDLLL